MSNQTQNKTHLVTHPYLELNNQGQTLRLELTKDEHILGRDPYKADLLVPQVWQIISSSQAVLRREGDDYWIYDGDGNKPSTNGIFSFPNYKPIGPTKGLALKHETELRIGQDPKSQIQLIYFNPTSPAAGAIRKTTIALRNHSILIGRDRTANLQLNSPIVSRRHATIDANNQGQYVLTDHSSNGIFVNSKRVKNSLVLTEGAKILIGPFTLIYQGDELILINPGDAIRLEARELICKGKDRHHQSKFLLNNISFTIEPANLVALTGVSDGNQSFLLRTLLGIEPTDRGAIYANGEDLRQHFASYNSLIGWVPEDNAIYGELTVAENLIYAIKLRLAADVNIETILKNTLEDIELYEQRNELIDRLNNYQRKLVSIGVSLVADPKLLFLEEPTLGLDPGLAKKLLELLRTLADRGRTIIFTTSANDSINICDRLIFLGSGGHLCYFGLPTDIHNFFAVSPGDFAAIYSELDKGEPIVKLWEENYRHSIYYQRYIATPFTTKFSHKPSSRKLPKSPRVSLFRQLAILTQRHFQLMLRDRVYLSLSLLAAAIFPLLLAGIKNTEPFILSSSNDPQIRLAALQYLLVFSLSAIAVGFSNSLSEIVKEKTIFKRERLANLGLFPYLFSKFISLSALAFLETFVIAIVTLFGFEQPSPEITSWPIYLEITTFLTLLSSISLGLMTSAFVGNVKQNYGTLPLILLFQMIFSGAWFKLDSLFNIDQIANWISWLTISHWSVGAYSSSTWENLALNWGILGLHTVVYFVVTFLLQKRQDIFK
ncbi:maltooligosyl trehalose synthase [Oscillatoriales cyanobacterium USR001]|nr:maltooligosyl trehalose synthase [Oscillatoriales cyanobacterium USR001]